MEHSLDYSEQEWDSFTKVEQRIILMLRVHNMDIDQIRASLMWPLPAMPKRTFSNHKSLLMKKMSQIRADRMTNTQEMVQENHSEKSSLNGIRQ